MQRSTRNSGINTVFYKPASKRNEIYSGYFLKSPPLKKFKTEKSWKKRYFVLFQIQEEEHQLHYFKSKEEMERLCGKIDLSDISLLYPAPDKHEKWSWIKKTFKCNPDLVLFIKTKDRDFFLLGQSREDVNGLFVKLFNAMKKRPHKVMSSEQDICNGAAALEINAKLHAVKKSSSPAVEKSEDRNKRRASVPPPEVYSYPASFLRKAALSPKAENCRRKSLDSLYETMQEIKDRGDQTPEEDEVDQGGSLMESVNRAFHKLKTQMHEEADSKDREETSPASDSSSSSSENIATSTVEMSDTPNVRTLDKQSSTESLDNVTPEERDIEVKRADLKKHLSMTETEGKPRVSGWTGQPQSVCLFHKGDQILAINDLHVGSLDEFNMYLSRSLKSEVRVTILRLRGCVPLHLPTCLCTD
ncbi:pleckstrin homology domain-containing family S member 1-like isoform X2 [Brachionichthys hirsutus]|uniref:pleckstrin homology domain-containing family S member 1-like isoform X2 n=1 Tax=Brachionichthys hirsutus TaxID=412623 RepID=UPI003604A373